MERGKSGRGRGGEREKKARENHKGDCYVSKPSSALMQQSTFLAVEYAKLHQCTSIIQRTLLKGQ